MLKEIITTGFFTEITGSVMFRLNDLAVSFSRFMSGTANLRLISIILMASAIVLFILLLVILYIKSLVLYFQGGDSSKTTSQPQSQPDEFDEFADNIDWEKELEKELEQSQRAKELERQNLQEIRLKEDLEKENLRLREEISHQEQEEKKQKEQEEKQKGKDIREILAVEENFNSDSLSEREQAKEKGKNPLLDLDWEKGKSLANTENSSEINVKNIQYQQSHKTLTELLGLLLDMIGRNVDDLKMAQIITYRNQSLNSEEEILQTIDALRDFISLCNNGCFRQLRSGKTLPSEEDALYHLAQGDNTLALALIENLMDNRIDNSQALGQSPHKDEIFKETSQYAVTFGTLAALTDVRLATGSFELAIELAPENINAWSRVADMYAKAGSKNKAMQTYQSLLQRADEDIYSRQIANADKMLSQYYYEQGNNLQAAKLYNESKSYYDGLGLNRRLERQEVEILSIIENNQQTEIQNTITKLLATPTPRSYA